MKSLPKQFPSQIRMHALFALALAVYVAGDASAQARVDLRKEQTPIRSQGRRGTCTSFAVAGAMEAAYKRAGHGEIHLSEEFSHDVAKMMWLSPPDANRSRRLHPT